MIYTKKQLVEIAALQIRKLEAETGAIRHRQDREANHAQLIGMRAIFRILMRKLPDDYVFDTAREP